MLYISFLKSPHRYLFDTAVFDSRHKWDNYEENMNKIMILLLTEYISGVNRANIFFNQANWKSYTNWSEVADLI